MDAEQFDTLARSLSTIGSRRRALTAAVSGALSVAGLAETDAKKKKPCPPCKKHKKGKCKGTLPDGVACAGGTCQGGSCFATAVPPTPVGCPADTKPCDGECIPTTQCCAREDCPTIFGYQCCNGMCSNSKRAANEYCERNSDCCSDFCLVLDAGTYRCAETCLGNYCTVPGSECCRGVTCQPAGSDGQLYCGGCGQSREICETDADCCYSSCTTSPDSARKHCRSYAGGKCRVNEDCKSCVFAGECTVTTNGTVRSICYNGICGCPDECCKSSDCGPGYNCVRDSKGLNGVCKPQVIGT